MTNMTNNFISIYINSSFSSITLYKHPICSSVLENLLIHVIYKYFSGHFNPLWSKISKPTKISQPCDKM